MGCEYCGRTINIIKSFELKANKKDFLWSSLILTSVDEEYATAPSLELELVLHTNGGRVATSHLASATTFIHK